MISYVYRAGLKPPGRMNIIDFSNPKLAPMLKLLVKNIREETHRFDPPSGIRCRIEHISAWDNHEIECFVVEPEGCTEEIPSMLYCHGGGFFLPIQPMMLKLAAQYAKTLRMRIYLPEYRFLPDYANPYPFKDCLSVLEWIQQDLPGNAGAVKNAVGGQAEDDIGNVTGNGKILLYGESAGAALAAGLTLWQKSHGKAPACGQLLIYPALDNHCGKYASMHRYSESVWSLRSNLTMWRDYLKNGECELGDYIIPMQAEKLEGLPPAYIEPQEIDILKDEAIAYADKLKAAGNRVELNLITGSYHGFDSDVENPAVQEIVLQRMQAMKRMLEGCAGN